MKVKLIVFSGPMARAILDDRKTQMRRVIVPQPPTSTVIAVRCSDGTWNMCDRTGSVLCGSPHQWAWKCPYAVGQRLLTQLPRLSLRVTDVRAQRVQGLSLAEINAEGYPGGTEPACLTIAAQNRICWCQATWNSLNAKRGYSYDTNPWVWAVTFEREKGSE